MLMILAAASLVLAIAHAQLRQRYAAKAAEEDNLRAGYEDMYSGPPSGGQALHCYNECIAQLARYKRLKAVFGLAALSCLAASIILAVSAFMA